MCSMLQDLLAGYLGVRSEIEMGPINSSEKNVPIR